MQRSPIETQAVPAEETRVQRWQMVLALFAVTSVIETFGVGHILRFLPLYLRQVGTPAALVPSWTGFLAATTFVFGLPLVPFWGVWADRYREVRPTVVSDEGMVRLALRALRLVFTTPVTRLLFGIFGLGILAQQLSGPFFPLVVQRLHPGPGSLATTIGLVFGASALVGALLSPIAGFLGDRVGFRQVLVAAALVGAGGLASMALAPSIAWLTVSAIFFGAASASMSSMIFALLATMVPEDRRSTTLNLVYIPLYLSGIIGGSLGALLVHGGLNVVLLTGAGMLILAGGLARQAR